MFALKDKKTNALCFTLESKRYLIWDTEEAAWRFLINEVGDSDREKYGVIEIRSREV